MEPTIVGLEAIDPLREADYTVAPFQRFDQFADAPARNAAFECFVLRCLDQLAAEPELKRFGLKVSSQMSFDRESPELPKVIVAQKVRMITEGAVRPLVNAKEFYTSCFPFNGVWEGEFSLSQDDDRVKRYLAATARKDHEERRCMLALLSAEADRSFSAPALEIRPE